LYVGGHVLRVAQLGPDFLVLNTAFTHAPADAEIAMSIDGHQSRWPVRLLDGIHPGQRKTRIGKSS
jgi:hypothetical protein